MRQMWSTHTAVELELQLLCQGMDHMHDRLYWAGEVEREEAREVLSVRIELKGGNIKEEWVN